MKLKSILSRMDEDDIIEVYDGTMRVGEMQLYRGPVWGMRRHNHLNSKNVKWFVVYKNVLHIDVGEEKGV